MTAGAPFFSVITPVYQTPPAVLQAAIESVKAQQCADWEFILVDDCSPSEAIRSELRAAADSDPRIRIHFRTENGGISAASNDAIDMARGQFLVLLDHDDLLTDDALTAVAAAIEQAPDTDYAYSDEDKIDAEGVLSDELRKPEWSPERLRHTMYTGHLSVLRTELVRSVGGFRPSMDGSQDHDLVLRVTERARRIVHVPEVLYHWRMIPGSAAESTVAKPYAWLAGQRAVQEHLSRSGIDATAELGRFPGFYRVQRRLDAALRVSIVVPTRGQSGAVWGEQRAFVVEAVRSALARTAHTDVEIIVVHDSTTPKDVLAQLKSVAGKQLVLVPYDSAFNFSEKCNLGVLHSTGDVIVLLNDDVEVKSDGWLEALVSPLSEPDVGMVGARLVLSDGSIQHAGHAYLDDDWRHPYYGSADEDAGYFGTLIVSREVSGVTAACAAIRRGVYDEVGGLSEKLPVNYNDIDLSYKVRAAGYRILWIWDCELYHFESRTRSKVVAPHEAAFIRRRWGRPRRDAFMPEMS